MKEVNRREFISIMAAMTASGLLVPGKASASGALMLFQALAPVLVAILTARIQAASASEVARIQAEAARVDAYQNQYDYGAMARQTGYPIRESQLCRDNSPVDYRFPNRIDNVGTDYGLSHGFAHVQRAGYGGSLSAAELRYLVPIVARGDSLPIPVNAYLPPSDQHVRVVNKVTGDTGHSLYAVHPLSRARNPTREGWDLASVILVPRDSRYAQALVLDREEIIRA